MEILNFTMNNKSLSTLGVERNNSPIRLLLPEGVELYEYLLGDGLAWIDTLYILNDNCKVELEYLEHTGTANLIFGSRSTYKSKDFILFTNSLLYMDIGGTRTLYSTTQNIKYKVTLSKTNAVLDTTDTSLSSVATFSTPYTAALFNLKATAYPNRNIGKINIYYCKIYENNTLVRNFLPCKYNGVAGMWDTVTNSFFGNLGSGSFTVGSKVELKLFEYLSPSGNAYINSKTELNQNTKIETKASITNGYSVYGSTAVNKFRLFKDSNAFYAAFGAGRLLNSKVPEDGIYKIVHSYNQLLLNESPYETSSGSQYSGYYITICGDPGYGATYSYFSGQKLYYFKIYDNNKPVRDFLPCSYNGSYGLWDRVNLEFYPNAGTGTFTVGAEIPQIAPATVSNVTSVADSSCPRYKLVYSFNNSIIQSPNISDIKSVSVWVKFNNVNSGLICFALPSCQMCFGVSSISPNNLNVYCNKGGGDIQYSNTLNTNWHHIVVVKNDKNDLYIDGVKQLNLTSVSLYSVNSDTIQIGKRTRSDLFPFTGKMSDFKIFNTALTDEEVYKLYKNGVV